jgi:hypothetical protein
MKNIFLATLLAFSLSGCSAMSALSALGGGSSSNSGTQVKTNANLNVGGEQNGIKKTTSTEFNAADTVTINTGVDPFWIIIALGGTIAGLLFLVGLLVERPNNRKRKRVT